MYTLGAPNEGEPSDYITSHTAKREAADSFCSRDDAVVMLQWAAAL